MTTLRYRPALLFLPLLIFASGCTELRLISEYDERTDQEVTGLQKRTGQLFSDLEKKLGTPGGDYVDFEADYDSLMVDLRALTVRAEARPKNDVQVTQLSNLREQLAQIAERHRSGRLRSAEIEPARLITDQSFRVILRLELAKKRGDEG